MLTAVLFGKPGVHFRYHGIESRPQLANKLVGGGWQPDFRAVAFDQRLALSPRQKLIAVVGIPL
ncbi:MAG: hypothetical protein HYS04_05595 [Acidobacteria bacterium]|nr:hypothetical protein [Acidobacteriota bacterium]